MSYSPPTGDYDLLQSFSVNIAKWTCALIVSEFVRLRTLGKHVLDSFYCYVI